MNTEIEIGRVYKHNSSFNGVKFSTKVLIIEKDEKLSTKKIPKNIVFHLTTPRIAKTYRQVLTKWNYFWTTPEKLERIYND